MTTTPSNNRASLLAGLRTGGVRSASTHIPHTAAPGGSFNIQRFASQHHHQSVFPEEDEDDFIADMPPQEVYVNKHFSPNRQMPVTAAVDGPNNRFSQHQQRGMNPNSVPFTPSFSNNNMNMMGQAANMQTQAFQMQMMQMEMLRLQALQAQQLQAEILAQAQAQAQADNQKRRASLGFAPPASAGPASTGFDLRSGSLSAQMRRSRQDQNSALGDEPMTAALGGRFGSRVTSLSVPQTTRYTGEENNGEVPPTPSATTVISGGTSLGNTAGTNNVIVNAPASKSDSASSWRRSDKNNSVLRGNRNASSPSVKVTPPPPTVEEQPHAAPPGLAAPAKTRPIPLRFSPAVSQPIPAVTIDTSDSNDDDADSTSSSKSGSGSGSSPTTPHSSSSNEMPLSPREEASKKLYEGLGIGRPRSSNSTASGGVEVAPSVEQTYANYRIVSSQPTRQPRGPPSGADELGPKNFATRIRRKAIGGLGMLMGARERRELVEVF